MTTDDILRNLRSRLAIITRQLERYQEQREPDSRKFLVNAGRVDAMLIEQSFLADLISQIEQRTEQL